MASHAQQNHQNSSYPHMNQTGLFDFMFRDFQLTHALSTGSYCTIVISLFAVVADFQILLTLHQNRNLITPFTVHIINLTIIEIAFICLFGPFYVLRYLHREKFHLLPYCGTYKFCGWVLGALQLLQHGIMCGDRFLALRLPMWYRNGRSIRVSVGLTVGALVYILVWYLPVFIVDANSPLQRTKGIFCDYYVALPFYWFFVQIVTYFLPFLFLCVSYPILMVFACCLKRHSDRTGKIIE